MAKGDGRKGGRVTAAKAEERRATIEAVLLKEGHCTGYVRQGLMRQWGVTRGMVDKYVRQVVDRMADVYDDSEGEDLEIGRRRRATATVARIRRAQNEMAAANKWGPWVQAETLVSKITGIQAPTAIDLDVKGQLEHTILTAEQLMQKRAELEEYLDMRDAEEIEDDQETRH